MKPLFSVSVSLLLFFFSYSCRTVTSSKTANSETEKNFVKGSFVSSAVLGSEETSIQLSSLSKIKHTVFKETLKTETGGKSFGWRVKISLSEQPALRAEQIAILTSSFGQSPKIDEDVISLDLRQFLPKSMQLTLDKGFDELKESKYGLLLGSSNLERDPIVDNFVIRTTLKDLTNCWTTAYEVLRDDKEAFMTFFASDLEVMSYIAYPGAPANNFNSESSKYSKFIKQLTWQEACIATSRRSCSDEDHTEERNKNLKPGDLLLIYRSPKEIEHAAIYIDQDFYFERTGAKGKNYLYRLVPFSEIAATYNNPESVYRYRRFFKNKQLPNPLEVFGKTHPFEQEVLGMMSEELKRNFRPAYQPEAGDSRDMGLYRYQLHLYE